jgi:hypothetical protein
MLRVSERTLHAGDRVLLRQSQSSACVSTRRFNVPFTEESQDLGRPEGPGGLLSRWSQPPPSGWTGGTRYAYTAPSPTSHRPNTFNTLRRSTLSCWSRPTTTRDPPQFDRRTFRCRRPYEEVADAPQLHAGSGFDTRTPPLAAPRDPLGCLAGQGSHGRALSSGRCPRVVFVFDFVPAPWNTPQSPIGAPG